MKTWDSKFEVGGCDGVVLIHLPDHPASADVRLREEPYEEDDEEDEDEEDEGDGKEDDDEDDNGDGYSERGCPDYLCE